MLEIPHLRKHPTEVVQYDVGEFPFAEAMAAILSLDSTAELYNLKASPDEVMVTRETDQSLNWHKVFYGRLNSRCDEALDLLALYDRFIRTYVSPLFGERVIYQTIPSFRVHLPNNKAVGKFHTDGDFGHQPQEYNFWLPFTDTQRENTVWVVDNLQTHDPEPMILHYGEILTFNAVRKEHGNYTNTSGKARVSWDFRVVPESEWNPDVYEAKAINTGARFAVGDYFKEMRK